MVRVAKSIVASMSTSLCPLSLGVSTKWCPSTFRPKQDSSLDSAESTCDHLAEVAELIAPFSSFRVFSTQFSGLGRYGEEHLDFLFRTV